MVLLRAGCLGAFVLAALGDAATVAAQPTDVASSPETTPSGEAGRPAPLRLDTVSVTATRNPLAVFEYLGMVSVIEQA